METDMNDKPQEEEEGDMGEVVKHLEENEMFSSYYLVCIMCLAVDIGGQQKSPWSGTTVPTMRQ